MENNYDIYYMKKAIEQSKKALEKDEVPIGAVIVLDDKIIGQGYNLRETSKNALTHAEIIAINQACRTIDSWRLCNATIYVTLEPCPMCMGAIINSRIKRVVYGAKDPKAGALESKVDLNSLGLNHKVEVTSGVLEQECSAMLSDFFAKLRVKRGKNIV